MRLTRPIVAIVAALLVAACEPASVVAPSPSASLHAMLVFANWVPDPKVNSGPEPGYRPAFTGLTGHDIRTAAATIDGEGLRWVVDVWFTPEGASLFAKLTRDNVAACPGDPVTGAGPGCPQRHLAIWVDLTQTDIDNWEDPTYAARVSQPYDLRCLAQSSSTNCPKLVSNPITLEEIPGGEAQIGGAFTQQTATELADAIRATT